LGPKLLIFGKALEIFVGFERRAFERSSRDVGAVQERVLLDCITRNAASDFGASHGFSKIKSVKDFQKAMPVTDYEYFRPFIDKVIEGKEGALLGPREKVLMFATTSGSTGKPKYIPVTKTFVGRYRRGWRVWGSYVLRRFPRCFYRKIMHVVAPVEEEFTAKGIPCGGVSGLIARMQRPIVRSNYALPPAFSKVKDIPIKTYIGMRIALPQDVGLFSAANPATVLLHFRTADERKEDIIRDLADGTCKGIDKLEGGVRDNLLPYIKKDAETARRLERIVKESGRLYPGDYWPNLDLIACWKGGPPKIYGDRVNRYAEGVPIWDVGLIASEARMTIPMDHVGSAGPLDIENNFFEFIPEESIDEPSPPVLLPGELEIGKKYFILLTTCAGLYRYNISDVVEVVDFFYDNPVVSYINKGERFSNIMGEKISEYQVVTAMEQALRNLRLDIEHFSLALCVDEVPYYSILVEKNKVRDVQTAQRLMSEFDRALKALNIEYLRRRRSGKLKPVSLRLVSEKSFKNYLEGLCSERNGRLEQFKHTYVINDEELLKKFEVLEEKFMDV